MSTKKYKDTTALTGEDFPPLSRHSTKMFNPKFLSVTPPHKNTLSTETARQTHDNRCNNTINIKNPPANNYNKLHEIKTKNRKCNMHQDLSNNSATTRHYQEKENTNQEITNFIQHYIQQYLQ